MNQLARLHHPQTSIDDNRRRPLERRTARARAFGLAVAVIGAALVAPGAAGASTFCVNSSNCPLTGSHHSDLQPALDAALAHGGPDQVLVGDKGSPYLGSFTYLRGTDSTNTVEIVGDGPVRPLLAGTVGDAALTLDGGSLEGIDVKVPFGDGLGVSIANGRLGAVKVFADQNASDQRGVLATGRATLDGTVISHTGDGNLGVTGSGVVDARNVRLENGGATVASGGILHITGSRVSAPSEAIQALSGGLAEVSGSVLTTTGTGGFGVVVEDASLALDHVTVAHRGERTGNDTAVRLTGRRGGGRATLRGVALAGYSRGFERIVFDGSSFPVTADESVWDSSHDVLGGAAAGAFIESGNAHAEPALVNLAAGDLRPRGSSAQVDRDATTSPARYFDIDGLAAVDGDGDGVLRPDAGAFEYRRVAPQIDSALLPAGGDAGSPLRFGASASDADGDKVGVRWEFGDGGVADGSATTHAYAAPGVYQASVTAADEGGVSVRRTFAVAVTGVSDGGGAPTGGSDSGADAAPLLGSVRLSARRLSVRRAARLRLRFAIDEAATLRIVPRRVVGGRLSAARGAITRRVAPGAGSLALAKPLRRLRLLRPGRIALTVSATDSAGQRSPRTVLKLRLTR